MTQDEIIRMARDAGFDTKVFNSVDGDEVIVRHGNATSICISDELKRFAALVAAHAAVDEREACAKVADGELMNTNMLTSYPPKSSAAWNIAAAIRARSIV